MMISKTVLALALITVITITPAFAETIGIEVNGVIVERNKYTDFILSKDDKVEIVHFIGGG